MDPSLVHDAATLIAFALRPRTRPGSEPQYEALLRRYRHEGAMRVAVETIADGLGLSVLGDSTHGLSLGAQESGPFAPKVDDYKSGLTVELRMVHGLVLLSIAAYAFPTGGDLDDSDDVLGANVSVDAIVRFVVDRAEDLARRDSERPDDDPEHPELAVAYRTVRRLAETRASKDGRRTANSLEGVVHHALEYLREGGLLRHVSEAEGSTYQVLGAYRLHVRELAALELFRWVREAGGAT